MAVSYEQAYGDLGSVYDPQVTLLQQQQTQAEQKAVADQASLDQAKVNAFKDIELSANRKGMLFSGFSPAEQAQYTGTKYLPAVANLKATLANTRNTLVSKIQSLYGQRQQSARQTVADQIKAEQDQAYREQQLGLSYARLARSGGGGISPSLAYRMQQDAGNAGNEFLKFVTDQFKRAGGQGNTGISRQQQDAWANQWFQMKGVQNPQARQMYWDLFNSAYNRPNNPYADPRYKR